MFIKKTEYVFLYFLVSKKWTTYEEPCFKYSYILAKQNVFNDLKKKIFNYKYLSKKFKKYL